MTRASPALVLGVVDAARRDLERRLGLALEGVLEHLGDALLALPLADRDARVDEVGEDVAAHRLLRVLDEDVFWRSRPDLNASLLGHTLFAASPIFATFASKRPLTSVSLRFDVIRICSTVAKPASESFLMSACCTPTFCSALSGVNGTSSTSSSWRGWYCSGMREVVAAIGASGGAWRADGEAASGELRPR